jgi:hypothetical protein
LIGECVEFPELLAEEISGLAETLQRGEGLILQLRGELTELPGLGLQLLNLFLFGLPVKFALVQVFPACCDAAARFAEPLDLTGQGGFAFRESLMPTIELLGLLPKLILGIHQGPTCFLAILCEFHFLPFQIGPLGVKSPCGFFKRFRPLSQFFGTFPQLFLEREPGLFCFDDAAFSVPDE